MRLRILGSVVALAAAAALAVAFTPTRSVARADGDRHQRDDDRDDDHGNAVDVSFSTVGDSRQDPVTADPTTLPLSGQDAIWLQNTKVWSRILREIEDRRSNFLFFNGDMIMGYGKANVPADTSTVDKIVGSELMAFHRQYGFWRGMVANLMEVGTYVVPVPGNHETQWKKAPAGGKHAQVENENAWRANMSDLILDNARFQALFGEAPTNAVTGNTATAGDSITTDQSGLTYSFDFRGCHFAVVNTDPVGTSALTGFADSHAPWHWLSADLAAAAARKVKHVFVFGHKPAFTYYYGVPPTSPLPATPSGLDVDTAERDAFWAVIEQYGATYFCGHEHIFNMSQPTKATGGKAWQILVGSGGSPFEAAPTDSTVTPTDRAYAWADVKVKKNGRVLITAYGFSDQLGPTSKLQEIDLPK